MTTLKIQDVLPDRILIGRDSARLLSSELSAALARQDESETGSLCSLTLDFAGVEGVAPSFMDELLRVLEECVRERGSERVHCLIIANPPMRLSLKFSAIARSHAMSIEAMSDGSWVLNAA